MVSNSAYSPVSYTLQSDNTALIDYQNSLGSGFSLVRLYPYCAQVGYPSISGMTLDDAILLNGSVILLWCMAFGLRAVRKTL